MHALKQAVEATRTCPTGAHLTLAIGYGGRQEIIDAYATCYTTRPRTDAPCVGQAVSPTGSARKVANVAEQAKAAVTIRKAGPEILGQLQPLWLALHAHHQSVAPPAAYQPDERSWQARRAAYEEWLAAPGSFVLVAERGDDLVGYALVAVRPGPDDTWVSGDRLAELETLSVAPEERGQGIGSRLLDAVDAELARLGIGDLFIAALVGNVAAIRLYERRGLRPVMTYLARFAADNQPG
jgi:ribosomal protein S18 acetylase RimI-like enzyme